MEQILLTENEKRLQANRAYSAKLSWKRKETLELRRQIFEFIEVNFDIQLPSTYNQFKKYSSGSEKYSFVNEEYGELIKAYYVLGNFGESVGSLFDNEIYTHAHLFSKHRIDPVWNWKKSKLIRTAYWNYLRETKIYKQYTRVHITLTVPHKAGKFRNKEFYASELINQFNLIRKSKWWNQYVYAGEYGIEVSGSQKNGLHIHLHSLAFLKVKHIKKFREKLQEEWERATGAYQVWVENLYVYKKNDKGQYITELKDSSELKTYEQEDGTYISTPAGKVVVRKKFYISDEIADINKSNCTEEEKENLILELYTRAILETIKYHFKNESIMLDSKNYNIFLINEILKNTKGKRLYSRYGKFYKESMLNFSRFEKEDVSMNEANTVTVINPDTLEEVKIEETKVIIFYPEKLQYTGKSAKRPLLPNNIREFDYYLTEIKDIKKILKNLLEAKFKRWKKTG